MEKLELLFNINFKLLEVTNEIAYCKENNCEIPQELIDSEAQLLKDISQKIDNCADFLSFLGSQKKRFKEEIDALDVKVKRFNNMTENFKKYMVEVVKNSPDKKIKGETVTASLRKSKFVQIIDELSIPKEYFKEKISYSLSKDYIEEAIKNGVEVPGAEIWEKNHLVLK